MLPGVYPSNRKDGTPYYRSGIHFHNKHISLGSYPSETEANLAYREAESILRSHSIPFSQMASGIPDFLLPFEKLVTLFNFRDNNMYIKTPIYLHANYFSYYLSRKEELKFDIDDLFYYSSHRILRRGGYLYVNDYGMQVNLLSRYGIRNFAVAGKDFTFSNGDSTDFRYSNIIIINKYYGVERTTRGAIYHYQAKIHINGCFLLGSYHTQAEAAVAYNKAVDAAKVSGIQKNFPENYILEYTPKEYASVYTSIRLPDKYLRYLHSQKDTGI